MGITRQNLNAPLTPFARIIRVNHGFTLIELLIVLTILGILAATAFPKVYEFRNKARSSRAAAEIRGLEKDIIAYASEKGNYPPDLATVGMASLKDPWGNNYVYSTTITRFYGLHINTDFDLYSKGPDGATAADLIDTSSLDDVIRFKDGAFDDVAEKYGI